MRRSRERFELLPSRFCNSSPAACRRRRCHVLKAAQWAKPEIVRIRTLHVRHRALFSAAAPPRGSSAVVWCVKVFGRSFFVETTAPAKRPSGDSRVGENEAAEGQGLGGARAPVVAGPQRGKDRRREAPPPPPTAERATARQEHSRSCCSANKQGGCTGLRMQPYSPPLRPVVAPVAREGQA